MATTQIRADRKIAYHIVDGPVEMYGVDAAHAVGAHPLEWSFTPWDPEAAAAARAKLHEKNVAVAREVGAPEPAPPPEPEMTDEDIAAIREWKAERDKAAAIVEAAKREEAERQAKEAEVASARATLDTPPPQPRRPLTGAAKANAERTAAKRAAEDEAAKDAARDTAKNAEAAKDVGKPADKE